MMQHSNLTQNQRILDYMERYGSITQLEALNACSVMRLASRISDLRRKGHPIEGQMVKVTNKYGETCRVKRYYMGSGSGG